MKSCVFLVLLASIFFSYSVNEAMGIVEDDPMMRKSIIYDKKTPDVFYCPIVKPEAMDEMIVKARALSKLCEFNGKPVPKGHKSDCYNDADETEYACKEKKRILKRMTEMDPPYKS